MGARRVLYKIRSIANSSAVSTPVISGTGKRAFSTQRQKRPCCYTVLIVVTWTLQDCQGFLVKDASSVEKCRTTTYPLEYVQPSCGGIFHLRLFGFLNQHYGGRWESRSTGSRRMFHSILYREGWTTPPRYPGTSNSAYHKSATWYSVGLCISAACICPLALARVRVSPLIWKEQVEASRHALYSYHTWLTRSWMDHTRLTLQV